MRLPMARDSDPPSGCPDRRARPRDLQRSQLCRGCLRGLQVERHARARRLCTEPRSPSSAASAADAAAQLLPERLYALSLVPQEQLRLAVPLGKKAQFDGRLRRADPLEGLRGWKLPDIPRPERLDRRRRGGGRNHLGRLRRRRGLQGSAQIRAVQSAERRLPVAVERSQRRQCAAYGDRGSRLGAAGWPLCLNRCRQDALQRGKLDGFHQVVGETGGLRARRSSSWP